MAVYYVSSLASGSGDGSLGSPWTLEQGAAGAGAGDELRIINDGVYQLSNSISFPVAGDTDGYVTIKGANASGIVDGSKPKIDGANLMSTAEAFTFDVANQIAEIEFLEFINIKAYAINTYATIRIRVANCGFTGVGGDGYGVFVSSSSSRLHVVNCIFQNLNVGIGSTNQNRFQSGAAIKNVFINCNTGIIMGAGTNVLNNVFIRNGVAVKSNYVFTDNIIADNTFFKCSSDAIQLNNTTANRFVNIYNNIFRSNGGYAINTIGAPEFVFKFWCNCFSNNSSGDSDLEIMDGFGNIHADPLFVSETEGSENLCLQPTSPCINAGLNPYGY